MKKIILWFISLILVIFISVISYLSFIGYETNKFNSILENKISSNISDTKINLELIKIKINIKNLSFFVTTSKPSIKYHNNDVDIKRIDAYINVKSLLIGKPEIDKINIISSEIKISDLKDIVKYQKPSNLKRLFLNETEKGKIP